MVKLHLVLGIKRKSFRADDAVRAAQSDRELAAKRPGVLGRLAYRCGACAYESKMGPNKVPHLDIHHRNDDHNDNTDANFALACHTCHPWQHIGELAARTDGAYAAEGLGANTMIAQIPEISAADLNLLQRAVGAALLDPAYKETAEQILEHLAGRSSEVSDEFGTCKPADFAAAMAELSQEEYEARDEALADLRLMFTVPTLEQLGREFRADNPGMPTSTWNLVSQGLLRKAEPRAENP
jgi:intracellular multiplication protein IcmJ